MNDSSTTRANSTQTGTLIAALGGLLLLTAWVLGFTQVKQDGVDCGTAFGGETLHPWVSSEIRESCAASLDSRQALTWTLAGVGTGVVVLGLVVAGTATSDDERDS